MYAMSRLRGGRRREQRPLQAVALASVPDCDKRDPVRRLVDEVELILGLARRRARRGPSADRSSPTRGSVKALMSTGRDLVVPEVEIVGPRAQPQLLVERRAGRVGEPLVGRRVDAPSAGARQRALRTPTDSGRESGRGCPRSCRAPRRARRTTHEGTGRARFNGAKNSGEVSACAAENAHSWEQLHDVTAGNRAECGGARDAASRAAESGVAAVRV